MKKIPIYLLICLCIWSCDKNKETSIDRYALVSRHDVIISGADTLNSLTVGNGDFAFTVDITGLQSFPEKYLKGVPLGTLSNWGWHSYPNPEAYSQQQVIRNFEVSGREVGYYHDFGREKSTERAKASGWLRQNPHRMNLGVIGLKLYDRNNHLLDIEDIENPHQELKLWQGEIHSSFEVEGVEVKVTTICHPREDMVAVNVKSALIKEGRLKIDIQFPEADPGWKNTSLQGKSMNHKSQIIDSGSNFSLLEHIQDSTHYFAGLSFSNGEVIESGKHSFTLLPSDQGEEISFFCEFEQRGNEIYEHPEFEFIRDLTNSYWETFWSTGGAVDFSACTDPRAFELERRVVLSRYLTQVQCSGFLPPQETGLTFNSWHGKHHLEMHWWHVVHFALWQKEHTLEKQMEYYPSIYQEARKLAEFQGYEGIRWPKMTGPDGITSPSTVGNYLIWQQPHYIYFAELMYRISSDTLSTLSKYKKLVYETADFMASFPVLEPVNNRYVLAPPLIPAQETFSVTTTVNPAFELSYWKWALNTAIEWKERSKEAVPPGWKKVEHRLAQLSVFDSLYLFTEDGSDSYTNHRYLSDHPMILGCLGILPPSDFVDPVIMDFTFARVVTNWNWEKTWGWDFPMVAMSAGALGRLEEAMDYLLLDVQKNTYLANGHNYQDERLTLYLPGNGGLLTAVARMCTGDQFPKNGLWNVRWENLNDF